MAMPALAFLDIQGKLGYLSKYTIKHDPHSHIQSTIELRIMYTPSKEAAPVIIKKYSPTKFSYPTKKKVAPKQLSLLPTADRQS